MTNSNGSKRGRRGGQRIVPVAAVAAVFGVALFGATSTASASSVLCEGSLVPLDIKHPGIDAKVDFTCNEEIRGFSVITNKTFDFFGTEVDVLLPDGNGSPQSATIQCEGNVPGPGFGCGNTNRNSPSGCEAVGGSAPGPNTFGALCTNAVSAGNTSEIQVGFPQSPCKPTGIFAPRKGKLIVWLSVLTEPLIGSFNAGFTNQGQTAYTRGQYISAPFRLNVVKYNRCGPPSGASEEKSRKARSDQAAAAAAVRTW